MRSINFEKQEWDWSVVGYQSIFSSFKNWFYPCHFIGEDSRCSRDIKNMFQNNKYLIGHFLTKSADTSSYPGVLFALRHSNAFSSSKTVRLMVLSQGQLEWIYSETSQWRTCTGWRTKHLVPNVTIFVKFPPNSGHLSIADKFLKTRRCPLFRGFTVVLECRFVFRNESS